MAWLQPQIPELMEKAARAREGWDGERRELHRVNKDLTDQVVAELLGRELAGERFREETGVEKELKLKVCAPDGDA